MTRRIALLSLHSSPLATIGNAYAGGMNVYVLQLARGLSRAGIQVDVFTRRTDLSQPAEVTLAPHARLFHVDAGPPREVPKSVLAGYTDAMAEQVLGIARARGAQYDIIHSHYWLSGLAALALRPRFNAPVIHMFHTLVRVKELYSQEPSRDDPATRAEGETRVLTEADVIVGSTDEERDFMRKLYGFAPPRYRVIPPGVDLGLFQPHDQRMARREQQLGDGRLILFVGRPDRIKRFDMLLQALHTLPDDVRLVAVGGLGNKDFSARIRKLVQRSGLVDRVELRPSAPQPDLPLYYSAADVCAIPSMYESFGMVAVEAMACATPVVAFRVGGLATTVEDGVTGYLARPGSPEAFADALQKALEAPARATLGRAARERAERWGWAHVTRRTVTLYADVAATDVLLGGRRG